VAPSGVFTDWPDGASPQEVGRRVAANFAERRFQYDAPDPKDSYQAQSIHYAEVCTWYGALSVAELTGDRGLIDRLVRKFDPLLRPDGARHLPARAHVDDRVFGAVPFELARLTGDPKYLAIGRRFADQQWTTTTPDGITTEARYWIDDMYMITAVQTQAYRATGDAVYLDRAARTMAAYLDRLQQSNGLFYHAPDSPYFWARGNGWVAAGMTELLRSLPRTHPQWPRIMKGYRKMMAALLSCQGSDGLWRQLIDHPEAWPETSGTGMFTFAMVTGVKNGWLDAGLYGPAARKAWLGLVKHLDASANVTDVCVGTGKGYDVAYYLARPRETGNLHGQAPILWSAAALLRPELDPADR
jgi:rhamnogalacturonyl hydrolase YesR